MILEKWYQIFRNKVSLLTIKKTLFSFLIIIGILLAFAITYTIFTFTNLKDIKELDNYSTYSIPTKVYDVNGELITEFFKEKRELIRYQDLPEYLIQALIATEDNYFYEHHGINFISIFKGVFLNPLMGKRIRGGSSISQQLSKQLFTSGDRTVTRKLVELWYTFQIEKKYSKEEILELYFNRIYFGHGAYGVEAASNFYFNKHVSNLNLGEASFLAGLPQAPSRYSPINNYELAMDRHRIVLQSMANSGFISPETASDTWRNFWSNYDSSFNITSISANEMEENKAPYFTEYIRKFLQDKYGAGLFTDGYEIYTSLDLTTQRAAEKALKDQLDMLQEGYNNTYRSDTSTLQKKYTDTVDLLSFAFGLEKINLGNKKNLRYVEREMSKNQDLITLFSTMLGMNNLSESMKKRYALDEIVQQKDDIIQGAVIALNPKNGHIEAMIGGKQFSYSNQFNRSTQARRQVGSAMKVFFYALAFDNRLISPASILSDSPIAYEITPGNLWTPRNYDGTYKGPISARKALTLSINVVAVQVWDMLLKKLGYDKDMEQMALFFGFDPKTMKKRVSPVLSSVLGVGLFSPLEMARGFATFANGGKEVKPISVLRVKDRYGKVIDDFEANRQLTDKPKQVISEDAAFIMNSILNDVVEHGTAILARKRSSYDYPGTSAKTGTTSNWKDAWFTAYTKDLVATTWIGFDNSSKSLGKHHTGGYAAGPVSFKTLKGALEDVEHTDWKAPKSLEQVRICPEYGLVASINDKDSVLEYFLPGTVPNQSCSSKNKQVQSTTLYRSNASNTIHFNLFDNEETDTTTNMNNTNIETNSNNFEDKHLDITIEEKPKDIKDDKKVDDTNMIDLNDLDLDL